METCVIGDLLIPKGLTVAADVWTVHYDPQVWGPDADKFRPERYSAVIFSSVNRFDVFLLDFLQKNRKDVIQWLGYLSVPVPETVSVCDSL